MSDATDSSSHAPSADSPSRSQSAAVGCAAASPADATSGQLVTDLAEEPAVVPVPDDLASLGRVRLEMGALRPGQLRRDRDVDPDVEIAADAGTPEVRHAL